MALHLRKARPPPRPLPLYVAFELPQLPYPLDALEPCLSRETLEYHHGKHHKAYVDKLNQLVTGTVYEIHTLDEIVRSAEGPLFDNAAQVWNHNFYWNCMSPLETGGQRRPGGPLAGELAAVYGSVPNFLAKFKEQAVASFGSGWTWLLQRQDGGLAIENTHDADTPLRRGDTPLLACDTWEHAYYLDYRNQRAQYVDAFLKIVNWPFVEANFASRS